jgi:hypothetical protein
MASPLSLFMPVIPGTNLQQMAADLAQFQTDLGEALQSIGTVHYARTLILDGAMPNLQVGAGSKPTDNYVLAIITEYDGSFDDYIGDFVSKVGDVFNAFLKYVVGGQAIIPVQSHQQAFLEYLKANDASQAPSATPIYQAYTATVQDIYAHGIPPASSSGS